MRSFKFWFEKSAEAKANYAEAQLGNANRLGRTAAKSEEVLELIHGIPVKPEFRRMSAKRLRKRLDALAVGCSGGEVGQDLQDSGFTKLPESGRVHE